MFVTSFLRRGVEVLEPADQPNGETGGEKETIKDSSCDQASVTASSQNVSFKSSVIN